jgi:hypothetical protein
VIFPDEFVFLLKKFLPPRPYSPSWPPFLHINTCLEVGPLCRTGQVAPPPPKFAPRLVLVKLAKLAGANFTGGGDR